MFAARGFNQAKFQTALSFAKVFFSDWTRLKSAIIPSNPQPSDKAVVFFVF